MLNIALITLEKKKEKEKNECYNIIDYVVALGDAPLVMFIMVIICLEKKSSFLNIIDSIFTLGMVFIVTSVIVSLTSLFCGYSKDQELHN
jgi:galactitol-specific phosphotransferase system IIC component